MGKRAYPPLPTRPQLMAVYPALFVSSPLHLRSPQCPGSCQSIIFNIIAAGVAAVAAVFATVESEQDNRMKASLLTFF